MLAAPFRQPPTSDALECAVTIFPEATQELREGRELLRRIDSKYVTDRATAICLVQRLAVHYAALRVPGGNVADYRSLYFDTPGLRCYHDHRRGRRLRHKIRIRHYLDRALTYLELKTKRNEAVTEKHRLSLPYGEERLDLDALRFLADRASLPVASLVPTMRIAFRRVSLVGFSTNERVTLDLGLVAESTIGGWSFGDLVVVEVKQAPFCVRTPVMRALRELGVRERSMSKYATATAILRPEERRNRLLPDLRSLERMCA